MHWGAWLQAPADCHVPVQVWCRCVTTVFNYFVVTNFFWMFVEGCYLHTAIVMTYSTERLRKWLFLFIGWCEGPGGPAGSSGERILLTGSPPFILGPRTGPHCCLPSPGQPEEAGSPGGGKCMLAPSGRRRDHPIEIDPEPHHTCLQNTWFSQRSHL